MLGQIPALVCGQEIVDGTSFPNVNILAVTTILKVDIISPIFQGRKLGLERKGKLPDYPASMRQGADENLGILTPAAVSAASLF